jgi:hypothetical protein
MGEREGVYLDLIFLINFTLYLTAQGIPSTGLHPAQSINLPSGFSFRPHYFFFSAASSWL